MSRRVRRKLTRRGQEKVDCPEVDDCLALDDRGIVDWTRLPDDTVIQLFSCLNYRDRASLSSTCRTWRKLGESPCLWQVLDIRPHKCDSSTAVSLAPRCRNLQKLRFRGAESADAIIQLQAKSLCEISGDYCRKITDATLSVIAARHESLESLQLGPDFCERISSDAIKAIAICCPQLRRLRLSGIREVDGDAINALARHCRDLVDIGLIDCLNVDEVALGNVFSLRFLSVAGTTNMKWSLALQNWSKLPNLTGLDVSRTDIIPNAVLRLFSSSPCLKILCALYCPGLEKDASFVSSNNHKGKLLLSFFTDMFKEVASLFVDTTNKERNVFVEWRNLKTKDRKMDDVMNWLEWILSHSLLRIAESNPQGLDNFWLSQGACLLLSLMRSTQEEVQERAATGLATFVVIDDENASIHGGRAEAVMRDGGIGLLLNLARSWREGLQTEAAKAIANLSVNANVAKAVAEEGGISILANLATSENRLVAEEAAGGLWNLSVGEEHKAAIAEAGGVKALVDLIFKWSITGGEGVLERAAGALANLAADDKCSIEVATVGGVHALVKLAQNCKAEGVQEQAARALANLAAHGDSNSNNAAVGQEAGALEALVQLTRSPHDGVSTGGLLVYAESNVESGKQVVERNQSEPEKKKKRIVVLGTGWAGTSLLKDLDISSYDVKVVSPRNYFAFTPLLPSITCGTVEPRSIVEPVRNIIKKRSGKIHFWEAECLKIDLENNKVFCRSGINDNLAGHNDFSLQYDYLVIAVGAQVNTFNTPGVMEHCHFLKEVEDAQRIRRTVIDCFEKAVIPGQSEEERRINLHFVIVGGGPTGVEFASELYDFVHEDLVKIYPSVKDFVKITLIQSGDHILNTFDERISSFAEQKFQRDGIEVLTGCRVNNVSEHFIKMKVKYTGEHVEVPYGMVVWSTGVGTRPFVKDFMEQVGQEKRRILATDEWLRVKGCSNVYALGDCASVDQRKVMEDISAIFKAADKDDSGTLTIEEFRDVLDDIIIRYPQLDLYLKSKHLLEATDLFRDSEGNEREVDIEGFKSALSQVDSQMKSLPATAQVAAQQGTYLARCFNRWDQCQSNPEGPRRFRGSGHHEFLPFRYRHLGQFAPLGGEQAAAELPGDWVSMGHSTQWLWYSVYASKQVSWRTRYLVVGDWVRRYIFGRDSSRI